MHEHDDDLERTLTLGLREMAAMDAMGSGASLEVRTRLLEHVRAVARDRRRTLLKAYGLAAGLVIATAIPVWQLSGRTAAGLSKRTPAAPTEIATVFYPLTYSTVPVTQGGVVRLELSPTALAALGVEPPHWTDSPPATVMADVLVGEDGLARAVRFVQTAVRNK